MSSGTWTTSGSGEAPASGRGKLVVDTIVLGCGVSGIVAAKLLSRHGSVLMLDSYTDPGGNHISVCYEEMTFDIGSICFSNDNEFFGLFPELREQCVRHCGRWEKIAPNGRVYRYPFDRSELFHFGFIAGLRIATGLLWGRVRRAPSRNAAEHISAHIGSVYFDRSGLRHYVRRLFGLEAELVDLEFATKRLGWLTRQSSLRLQLKLALSSALHKMTGGGDSSAPAPALFRPRYGFGRYYEQALEVMREDGVVFRFGLSFRSIRRLADGTLRVETDQGVFVCRRLISTFPLLQMYRLASLDHRPNLKSVDLWSLFVAFRGQRRFSGTVLFNFQMNGDWKRLTMFSDIYGTVNGWEYFTVEITKSADGVLPDRLYDNFAAHMAQLCLLTGDMRLVGHHYLSDAYPVLEIGCGEERDEATRQLAAIGVETLGRHGRFQYIPHQDVAYEEAVNQLAASEINRNPDRAPDVARHGLQS